MIQAQNLCLSFGNQIVFDHISFIIQINQRIGLVGANGTGKSTLLRALVGLQMLDDGLVTTGKQFKIAYMPQEMVLLSQKTVFEEAFSTFEELFQALNTLTQLEPRIHDNPSASIIESYAQAQEVIKNLSYEQTKKEVIAVLAGLGFSEQLMQQPITTLSVGWKMRVVLAKLLLQKADFYFFDEPTNHLDIIAKDWFLQFLRKSSCGFLLVCHERYFLDLACSDILELERGKATGYKGNYSSYEQQKERAIQALEKAYEQQQREISQKIATIERFRASASKAKMAQSMLKELEKIERIELPPAARSIHFKFGSATRAGKTVLSAENLIFSFGTKNIFSNISFTIERGERVALIAPNGTGKTTLFNVLTGIYKPTAGSVILGNNVKQALFVQDQNAVLPLQKTIFEHICISCPQKTEQEIRGILGAFLFSNDMIYKKLSVLSGGEKNRVSMITVLMQDANFLMLDEPTNHLDMQSKEILLKALLGFNGTLFFVSHDHDFINKLATRILDLTPTGIESYQGNYSDYLYQKELRMNQATVVAVRNNELHMSLEQSDGKQIFELRKQLKKVEQTISKLEASIKIAELRFAELEYGTIELKKNEAELLRLRDQLERSSSEWEYLVAQLDLL